jgi:hypothetical protein
MKGEVLLCLANVRDAPEQVRDVWVLEVVIVVKQSLPRKVFLEFGVKLVVINGMHFSSFCVMFILSPSGAHHTIWLQHNQEPYSCQEKRMAKMPSFL